MLSPSQLGIPRIEPAKRIVQVGVVGEQLPVGEQRPTDVRARDHCLTDAEERPFGPVGIENMGDGQRRIGIGAIVKGDRHFGPISRPVRDHRPEPGDRRRVGANPSAEEQHGRQAGDGHEPARPVGIRLASLAAARRPRPPGRIRSAIPRPRPSRGRTQRPRPPASRRCRRTRAATPDHPIEDVGPGPARPGPRQVPAMRRETSRSPPGQPVIAATTRQPRSPRRAGWAADDEPEARASRSTRRRRRRVGRCPAPRLRHHRQWQAQAAQRRLTRSRSGPG